jgi:2-methylisocitrate lyase-like PEP mutase family enzyme
MAGTPHTFRALHEQDGAFIIPNPWDVGSARILAAAGFRALATTSAGLAFSNGLPEGRLDRETVLAHCRDIVSATPLPVSADLEKGFGDSPESVHETIQAAAATGLAGCSIEDHTGDPDNPIFDFTLAAERIAAAVESANGLPRDFVLTARCENLLWNRPGLDDVIARLQAYEAAGADVLYAPGLRDTDTIRTVCSALTRPVNVVMGLPGCELSTAQIAAAGAKRISVGSALARLAYGNLMQAAAEMAGPGTFTFARNAAGFAELEKIFRKASES